MKTLPVGLQLYTVRDAMEKSVPEALAAVKAMGYDYVETAGLFGYSYEGFKAELDKAEQMVSELKQLESRLAVAKVDLDAAEKQLTEAGYDIQFGEVEVLAQLSDKKNEIANFETNLRIAKEKARTIEAEYEAARDEAYSKLEKAKNELDAAKSFLLGLDTAKWFVNDRNDCLLGFESYVQMADRIKALTAAFPWFFFIVAALVCLNTMTRMIEEERTQKNSRIDCRI